MNKLSSFTLILFVFVMAIACSEKKDTTAAAVNNDEWPEMDEFHMIMAESFHPYKDSSNLEPAKVNAADLAKLAEKWTTAPLPEKVNTDEVKANLEQLKNDAAAFAQTVQTGDTTKIGESLTSLHDLFHKLQEAWYKPGKEGEEGHDHH